MKRVFLSLVCLIALLSPRLAAQTMASSSLANASTRGMAGAGEAALITGIVVKAPPGELRWVLVRALGPTLTEFGVQGALPDPSVWLYDGARNVIAANQALGDAPNAALLATVSSAVGAVPAESALEAAALVGVPAGTYTAVVRGETPTAGIALVEVYEAGAVPAEMASQTLSGLAAANPNLQTLATALRLTGLDVVLAGDVDFTVFAPTDAAFAALPAGTLDMLIANPTQLANVLRNHVVGSRVLSSALSDGQQVTTLLTNATPLTVDITGNTVRVGAGRVVIADVEAVNGVVHVIDAVLVP